MKRLLPLILILFLALPVVGLTLQGNAQYNAESAREEAFNDTPFSISQNGLWNYLNDPNYVENYKSLLGGVTKLKDRFLSLFSDGTYGVRYTNDPYHNYYYEENGTLFKVDVLDKPYDVYPHKSIAYNRHGKFMNATIAVSKSEQYLYDAEKKLMGHWVGNTCYDENGKVLMLRKMSK